MNYTDCLWIWRRVYVLTITFVLLWRTNASVLWIGESREQTGCGSCVIVQISLRFPMSCRMQIVMNWEREGFFPFRARAATYCPILPPCIASWSLVPLLCLFSDSRKKFSKLLLQQQHQDQEESGRPQVPALNLNGEGGRIIMIMQIGQ